MKIFVSGSTRIGGFVQLSRDDWVDLVPTLLRIPGGNALVPTILGCLGQSDDQMPVRIMLLGSEITILRRAAESFSR